MHRGRYNARCGRRGPLSKVIPDLHGSGGLGGGVAVHGVTVSELPATEVSDYVARNVGVVQPLSHRLTVTV